MELRKGQKVDLHKGGPLGEIRINLNWSQPPAVCGRPPRAIDLDLGCLYEMSDGRKGCVQALGNAFGGLDRPPYVALDADDRTGASEKGEDLRVNGGKIAQIRRILVYTFIYDGVADWQEADGAVTIQCPGSPELVVRMDEYGSSERTCAIAMLENADGRTFSVEKLVRFFNDQRAMDQAFGWGLSWRPGRK